MDYEEALARVRNFSRNFFASNADPKYAFHNLPHTEYVARIAEQIAQYYQLEGEDIFVISSSVWLSDLGGFKDFTNHEEKSAELAEEFLKKNDVPTLVIRRIRDCILSARIPQSPQNLVQEIVSDAFLYYLGTDEFKQKNKQLHKEYELLQGKKIGKKQWRKFLIQLLKSHEFHTSYCQNLLNEKKAENLEKIESKENEEKEELNNTDSHSQLTDPEANKYKTKREKINGVEGPGKGIETMFRVSSANHLKLSDMADSKAHIMITVNAIIISVLISLLLRKLDTEPHLVFPAMLLLTVSLVTIVFSILATRPNIPSGTFTQEDLEQKKLDLLFFGNYYKMNIKDYEEGMLKMMGDKEFLYGTLIRDIYSQGVVLGRKYQLLRISYSVFMYGLVVSVIAFALATIL